MFTVPVVPATLINAAASVERRNENLVAPILAHFTREALAGNLLETAQGKADRNADILV
jgi:hypothetical protein